MKRALTLALVLSSLCAVAQATTYSAVVVYGDSLSDNGNLYAATGQPGALTMTAAGPTDLSLSNNSQPASERPWWIIAWIGATTGIGNYGDGGTPTSFGTYSLPGMQTVFAATKSTLGPYLNGGLFVVWGGPDDFLSPSPLDTTPAAIVNRAVSNELGLVTSLELLGAQHILVPGMPDLGLTPYFQSLGPAGAAEGSALSAAFNAELSCGPSGRSRVLRHRIAHSRDGRQPGGLRFHRCDRSLLQRHNRLLEPVAISVLR